MIKGEMKMLEIKEQHEHDNVNHPKHYEREGAMECIDEMILIFGVEEVKSFCKLNAWKYRYRAADKNGEEDIKKSDWYLRKYKELSDSHSINGNYIISDPFNGLTIPCAANESTTAVPNQVSKTIVTC